MMRAPHCNTTIAMPLSVRVVVIVRCSAASLLFFFVLSPAPLRGSILWHISSPRHSVPFASLPHCSVRTCPLFSSLLLASLLFFSVSHTFTTLYFLYAHTSQDGTPSPDARHSRHLSVLSTFSSDPMDEHRLHYTEVDDPNTAAWSGGQRFEFSQSAVSTTLPKEVKVR